MNKKEIPWAYLIPLVDKPGWTPGWRDLPVMLKHWHELLNDLATVHQGKDYKSSQKEKIQSLERKLSALDAKAVKASMQCLPTLDAASLAEVLRPLLKSLMRHPELLLDKGTDDFFAWCFNASHPRVRKAAAQAVGASWAIFDVEDLQIVKSRILKLLLANAERVLNSDQQQHLDLGKTQINASERKALIEALGKSSDSKALALLAKIEVHDDDIVTRARLTLQRDIHRQGVVNFESSGSIQNDQCRPDFLGSLGIMMWTTPGIDVIAAKGDVHRVGRGLINRKGSKWSDLEGSNLWRDAGIVIGQRTKLEDARHDTDQLWVDDASTCVLVNGPQIMAATQRSLANPVRIRLGQRYDSKRTTATSLPKSQIWRFAEILDHGAKSKGYSIINDGRNAHWELRSVDLDFILVPLQGRDDRFGWRDATVDGSSDPTVAAAMVEIAELRQGERVYDPFCGAGTELILAVKSKVGIQAVGTDTSQEVLLCADRAMSGIVAAGKSGLTKDQVALIHVDVLNFIQASEDKFDVVITNPPFGMRTARGEARPLLQEFLRHIHRLMMPKGRLVMLSHAPNSTLNWASEGGLKLEQSWPIVLGKMTCELQKFRF